MGKQACKDVEVQCPFYLGQEDKFAGKKLFCESPVPESSMTLYFRRREDYQKQLRIFCCDHYKNCEVYRMVMQNYED